MPAPTNRDHASASPPDAERARLEADHRREANWKRFGPYLAERQWGTVREDYSADGTSWAYLPHDHARSRAYRWGEDGLLGMCDRRGRLCFALALWNGKDTILKERLFGLTGPEGNHGEDVKEQYFYLDNTPTHSYMRALYKYPQREFPYAALVDENARRTRQQPEFELTDTGIFDDQRYFDVQISYAKAAPDDILIALTVFNRGPEAAPLAVLPTVWFRNTWSWGRAGEDYPAAPRMKALGDDRVGLSHPTLGEYAFMVEPASDGSAPPALIFTENETNNQRLYGTANRVPYVKDAFHHHVVNGLTDAVNPLCEGTKAAAVYRLVVPAGGDVRLRFRLTRSQEAGSPSPPAGGPFADFEAIMSARQAEADLFYQAQTLRLSADERAVVRQAHAGLLWTKQLYHYDVRSWLQGDPAFPPPADSRRQVRNSAWQHVYTRDVMSVPDKWEYPWFAAWDLAFHMLPFARIDPHFAKAQLLLLTREWYMHPNGQLPAYEFEFGDVNPPVQAWAAWRVYKIAARANGHRDRIFLERMFNKLLINFTWWVNRKDAQGRNLFAGGFLGLDNIGVFDRSKPLPTGGSLEQADGTAWMAFFCATMLSMALELARSEPAYEDMASKFFEHFIHIADAMNAIGGTGLWDEADGFYYDHLLLQDEQGARELPLRVRSLVGLLPLIAVEVLDSAVIDSLPLFKSRMNWFFDTRPDLAARVTVTGGARGKVLLAIPSQEQLLRVLARLLSEAEFLSPHGIRSLSKVHQREPYRFFHAGEEFRVDYVPGESNTWLFGGNSNWRGPVWMPVNYLLIEALERYHHFYGDDCQVEYPTGSGQRMSLKQVARELAGRLAQLFLPDAAGRRPCHGDDGRFASDPHWRDLVLFYECFNGDDGRGVGASHQTGWTALVVRFLEDLARGRTATS